MKTIPFFLLACMACLQAGAKDSYDIVVYGSTGAGITAAVQAARMHRRVLLISTTEHIGGVASSGLGATDINRREAIGGLSREFYQHVYEHYRNPQAWNANDDWEAYARRLGTRFWFGRDTTLNMQWMFEPHIAELIFRQMLSQAGVKVVIGRLSPKNGVTVSGKTIRAIRVQNGAEYRAQMFIDASYEGDLMAAAGVGYRIGRESNALFGETMNGYLPAGNIHKSRGRIDPYLIKGDPSSGLLPFVEPYVPITKGTGDHRIQAYCYRFTLTDDPINRQPIKRPAGYDSLWFEHIVRWIEAVPELQLDHILTMIPIPNRKTDVNHADFVGANYAYPEGDYQTRDSIEDMHRDYVLGELWLLANDPRVSEHIRRDMNRWGLASDEFTNNGNFPHQIYVREARRLVGDYVMSERDVTGQTTAPEGVGLATYWFDSHVVSRYTDPVHGIQDEGCFWANEHVYPVSYRSIRPIEGACPNLLVPVCLSSTHTAYGSIRMEPVYMVLGQSAAIAAALCIDRHCTVQSLPYEILLRELVKYGQILNIEK